MAKEKIRMNPTVRALWVEALRSGKYKQTDGTLCNGEAYCCLGVLCDIHAQVTKRKRPDGTGYRGEEAYPPAAVAKWAGLPLDEEGQCNPKAGVRTLSSWNDSECASFKKIAGLIEKHL